MEVSDFSRKGGNYHWQMLVGTVASAKKKFSSLMTLHNNFRAVLNDMFMKYQRWLIS